MHLEMVCLQSGSRVLYFCAKIKFRSKILQQKKHRSQTSHNFIPVRGKLIRQGWPVVGRYLSSTCQNPRPEVFVLRSQSKYKEGTKLQKNQKQEIFEIPELNSQKERRSQTFHNFSLARGKMFRQGWHAVGRYPSSTC